MTAMRMTTTIRLITTRTKIGRARFNSVPCSFTTLCIPEQSRRLDPPLQGTSRTKLRSRSLGRSLADARQSMRSQASRETTLGQDHLHRSPQLVT